MAPAPPQRTLPSDRTRAYVAWVLRHGKLIWALALLATVFAAWRTTRLYMSLRSDLESLLPTSAPSVRALDELRVRTTGIRFLGVVIDTGNAQNLPAGEKLVDDLAARIEKYPAQQVAAVRKGISIERRFIEDHAPLYAELADLKEARKRIEARRDYEAAKVAEADLDDAEPPPPLDFADLEARYKSKDTSSQRYPKDRFSSAEQHATVLLVEVGGYATGTEQAQELLDKIRAEIASLGGTDHYAPGMHFGFAGDPAISVEELSALKGDLTFSSLVVLGLVTLVLLMYYRWWRSVPALGIPLLVSVTWSFALSGLFGVSELNSNSAFLGSIIIGNGVNFGIILMARYVEERRRGVGVNEALVLAVHGTRTGTITAAAAAAIAYGSLMTTRFRGFWQFGVIGGLGMLVCWAATFVLVPPLIAWLDRSDRSAPRPLPANAWNITGPIARMVARIPRAVVILGALVTVAAAIGSRHFGWDRFETDFSKMRRGDTWKVGEGYWGHKMDAVLGRYLTPVVILTDSPAQTEAIASELDRLIKTDPVLIELIDTVRTVHDVLPSEQEAKIVETQAIRKMLTPAIRAKIPQDKREQVDRLTGPAALVPIRPADLPSTFVTGMLERDGSLDKAVLVYPKPTEATWKGKLLIALAEKLRAVAAHHPGPDGRPARVAGSAPLSADITESMASDGPRSTAVALAGVLVLILAAFRWSRETLLIFGSLFMGVLWLVWSSMLMDVRINFANFIAFPITFGIGVDYAVNVMWRYRLDGARDVLGAVRSTGGAVGLASATTIIGYSSLLLANNQALFSFGQLSVVGEITCLSTAVIFLPALFLLLDRSKSKSVQPTG
ncbi:MAG: MMPL family transporter [Deltaproteobacteria bacterium]|nr:MMPL family transporter [Deltaproteobacteria bacterium]